MVEDFNQAKSPSPRKLLERISELEQQIQNLQRLQQTIERNTNLFEAVLASSRDGIALTRLDSTIILVVRSILGYGKTTLSGTSMLSLVHPGDRDNLSECYRRLINREQEQVECEVRLTRPDGTYTWVQCTITDMLDHPAVQALVHNYRDVTELKASSLAAAELDAVIEFAPFAVFSKSPLGDIVSWNDGSRRMFGYEAAEILGQHVSRLVPPELHQEEERRLELALSERRPIRNIRTSRICKGGSRIAIELTLVPLIRRGQLRGIVHISHPLAQSEAR